jgi:GH15 family glucan-1,4-alpha-glucosidase
MARFTYEGPEEPLVRRAALTLKMCDDWSNGSLVAAPTSSLPAPIGGIRNWDYRYTWIRDAAFAVFALRRIGFQGEADSFLGWVLDAFEQSGRPRIMHTLDGLTVPDEVVDPELEGYRRSAPVRWGNGATDQRQHDVYGEILDCADQWLLAGGEIQPALWSSLAGLADQAATAWRQPDQGIWEVRNEGGVFTYSAGLCHVALDRAVRIAERHGLPGRVDEWRTSADELRELILNRSWDEDAQTLSVGLSGGGALDASLLALPLRGVVPVDHPGWWRRRPLWPTVCRRATACSTATRTTSPPTVSPVTRGRSCCAASGWSTTWPARAGWTRPRSCTRPCARGQARPGSFRSRSIRPRVRSWGTSPRRSATSGSSPAE